MSLAGTCTTEFQNAKQLYKCALEADPRIRALSFREMERSGTISEASQFPNPVGELEGTKQEVSGSIVQPFEIGGKRSARHGLGEIRNETSRIEDQIEVGEIALEIAQNLNRLHQLNEKLELLEDTKRSLLSLTSRLRAKAVRTPEERTAVGLFAMQNTVIEARLISARHEQAKSKVRMEAAIGRKLTQKDRLDLPERRLWPNVDEINKTAALSIRLNQLNVQRLEGELKVQRSLAWPDLALGPYFKQDRLRGESSVGAKVVVGLPIWNRNNGAKQRAEAEFNRAKIASEHVISRESFDLETMLESYRSLVRFLEQSASSRSLQRSVKETLDLFSRGMVQPSNVIETYRTAFEAMEAIQDAESSALEQYWTLQIALGKIPREML